MGWDEKQKLYRNWKTLESSLTESESTEILARESSGMGDQLEVLGQTDIWSGPHHKSGDRTVTGTDETGFTSFWEKFLTDKVLLVETENQ